MRQLRHRTFVPRKPAIIVHEGLLQFLDMVQTHLTRRHALSQGKCSSCSYSLPHQRTGSHNPCRAHRAMRRTMAPPGTKQIRDVARIQCSQRNAVGRRCRMKNCSRLRMIETGREMVIHGPATIGNQVRKASLGLNIMLREHMIPYIPAAFAFARQEPLPVQRPILPLRLLRRVILDVVPNPESNPQELVAQLFRIVDTVVIAAYFQPPVIGAPHITITSA